MRPSALFLFVFCVSLVTAGKLFAQESRDFTKDFDGPKSHSTDNIIGQFDESAANSLAEPATITAKFTTATAEHPAVLFITAKIGHGKHTYSLTQPRDPRGGPFPTTIDVKPSPSFRLLSSFNSQPPPKFGRDELEPGVSVKVEEHAGQVTWYAPIELKAGVDPATLEIRGMVHMLMCPEGRKTGEGCQPVDKDFEARLATSADVAVKLPAQPIKATIHPEGATGPYQARNSTARVEGQLRPSAARPGESAELEFSVIAPNRAHVFAHADYDLRPIGNKPTLIAIETASGLVPHRATTDAPVKIDNSTPQFGPTAYHEGQATWKLRLDVPQNAKPGEYPIEGIIGYQVCTYQDGRIICEKPLAIRFAAALKVGDSRVPSETPVSFGPAETYPTAAAAAKIFADNFNLPSPDKSLKSPGIARPDSQTPVIQSTDLYELKRLDLNRDALAADAHDSLSYYIALAFVGGLILNLMPCVLPVIGLKVMSFVEQAGAKRSRALVLNLWFAAGIVFVFVVLGLLASLPRLGLGQNALGWGGQFGNTAFNVTIAAIVFAMALSLLGVWEVPIPGFFGSSSVHSAAAKEGPLGAFLKGVVTTVLATPCTAPFMASAVAWAITQPVVTTLAVFATLGIGMASPYVLIGVYPELLRFLPKPGAWMETFKQISGFVLLATVVFILSFIETAAVVPTLALLLGIAVACWIISRTPAVAEFQDRLKSWGLAGAVLLLFVAVSFGVLFRTTDAGWQPFSLARLKQVAVDEGHTVLVDFSADWCLNCKFFERTVLHSKAVEQAIKNSGAVTMYGDYTKYPPEIDDTIKALRANGVPVIAIFPGNAPYEPIVFRGGYRRDDIIAALESASGRRAKTGNASIAESTASAAQ